METLPNHYQLEIPDGCFPLSTDSMVLSHFVRLPKNARVLDLGSGCGTLGLLLCSRDAGCAVTGIERDERAHAAALANICRNGLENRLESLLADIQEAPQRLTPGSFDVCLSNPPYFSGGPAAKLTAARREDFCPVSALMKAAGWVLKYGGDFYLVHRPERLGELIAAGKVNLDHIPCEKPDRQVPEGAVITARGFGKARLAQVGGLTRKGRIGIVIEKYV